MSDYGHEGLWTNIRGETLSFSNLFSAPNPDNANYDEHYLMSVYETDNGQVLVDSNSENLGAFVCQMIFSEFTGFVWEGPLADNSTHVISQFSRSCSRSLIGDPPDCIGGLTLIGYHYHIFQLFEYHEAVQHCNTFGAKLYDFFGGVPGENDYLVVKMQYSDFWVGITDEETEGVWLNVQKQKMELRGKSLLLWATGHPNSDVNNLDDAGFFKGTMLLDSPPNNIYLMDAPLNRKLNVLCSRFEYK